ncbi:hypothetical protein ACU686_01000 [Yinghuangia aomiensis]
MVPACRHDGFDLRDFFLDAQLAADGRFRGSHTTYMIDAKPDDDPSDVTRFRYRRSHVLLGCAYGRLDFARGTGVVTVRRATATAGSTVHNAAGASSCGCATR